MELHAIFYLVVLFVLWIGLTFACALVAPKLFPKQFLEFDKGWWKRW